MFSFDPAADKLPHRIAVAIPTYKREELLRRLVSSIPIDWDIYVSDNDASLKPLLTPLPGVVSHSAVLIPMFANWNRALSLVDPSASHVFIPSDDDLFLSNAGDAVEQALARHPDTDMFVFGCDFFDEHDQIWPGYRVAALQAYEPGDGFSVFSRGVDARMPGILFRKSFLDQIGAFDERFELTASDSDLIQRALLLGRSVFVPETIGLYRVWAGSLTHVRIASDQWMHEIDLWTAKIAAVIKAGHQPSGPVINVNQYRDEILARNLLAALGNLLNKGEVDQACDFLRRHPVPRHATLATRLRLLRQRLRIWMRLQ
jgi:hypothetical protein